MTDMRATERLLEVIEESLATMSSQMGAVPIEMVTAQTAITELRRRGDTLVRRDDLSRVVDYASDRDQLFVDEAARDRYILSRTRLEIALGGKLR